MGTYYNLYCTKCRECVSFGKKLVKDDKIYLQGMYYEKENIWIRDQRVFDALQYFFFRHEGHSLLFANDSLSDIDDYQYVEFDELIEEGS